MVYHTVDSLSKVTNGAVKFPQAFPISLCVHHGQSSPLFCSVGVVFARNRPETSNGQVALHNLLVLPDFLRAAFKHDAAFIDDIGSFRHAAREVKVLVGH